ncbi:hypothetical protein [Terricaulis silvestris]|uniref:Uncharacterized protein n=1 Tax=Terricaulis silvestris TaxID=2686094 RepID=A0A6I6MSN8_9CAUL|nr:hypothetical protein [Terricaulis silvestris]QGZ94163.1 hypothetical protein DSM104635_00979 [Terricaulis silvestris]
MLTKLIAAIASLGFAALIAAPAAAQIDRSPGAMVGHWTGVIAENGDIPQYTLSVHINLDRDGDPVGKVEYDAFPCAGVWTDARRQGERWTLQETITEDVDRCAVHVVITIEQQSANSLEVSLQPVGNDGSPSTGMLQRR